jgi:hypothetical protein
MVAHRVAHRVAHPPLSGIGAGRLFGVTQAQPGLHATRCLAACAHGHDDRGGTGDDVATGKHAGQRGGQVLVGGNEAACVELDARGLADDGVGVGANGIHHHVDVHLEAAVRHGHRAAPARGVGLAQLHAFAADRAHVVPVVGQQVDGRREPVELDTFLLRVVDFLGPRRRFVGRAPVQAHHLFGAQPQAHPQRVHRGVAGADDGHAPARLQRRVVARKVACPHQVAACQQFVGRQHAVERFTRNAHEAGITRPRAHKQRMKAHFGEHLLQCEQPAHQSVALEAYAQLLELADLDIHHAVGQAEVGYAVLQHAAGFLEGFIDDHFAARLGHVGGAGHAGRPRADDAHLEGLRLDVGDVGPALFNRHVAHKTFQPADGHGLQALAHGAHAFALAFLRAHTPTHRRQQVGARDHVVGAVEVLRRHLADETGDVDAHRAATHAGLVGAVQAAFGFHQRLRQAVAHGHFVEVLHTRPGRLLGHGRARLRDGADGLFLGHGRSVRLWRGQRAGAPLRTRQLSLKTCSAACSVGR